MLRIVASLFAAVAAMAGSSAQCTNPWLAANGEPGLTGTVNAMQRWDPDGAGPQPEVWVLAGLLTGAGSVPAQNIITYEPVTRTWTPLGAGVGGAVHALAALPNGDLIAAGDFTTAGGLPANRVARWSNGAWSPIGAGFGAAVRALAVMQDGSLVAGGTLNTVGLTGIARWTGTAWTAMGAGLGGIGVATELAVLPNGDLLAAGTSIMLNGAMQWVVRWDGQAWWQFGTLSPASPVFASVNELKVFPNGDVLALYSPATLGGTGVAVYANGAWAQAVYPLTTVPLCGAILSSGAIVIAGSGSTTVARWNGTTWAPVGAITGQANALLALPGDHLLVGGPVLSGPDTAGVSHWDGSAWRALGNAGWQADSARVTGLPNGDFVASMNRGDSSFLGIRSANGWTPIGAAGRVRALATLPNGHVIAGGEFFSVNFVQALRVARWDGSTWGPLGAGISALAGHHVAALAVTPAGELIAGGRFTTAGGIGAQNIARWNGQSWAPLGPGLNNTVRHLAVLPDGNIVASGDFLADGAGNPRNRIARWNGSAWLPLGNGLSQTASDLATTPDGRVLVGGLQTMPGGQFGHPLFAHVWTWDGSIWQPIGGIINVARVTTTPTGDVIAGGTFSGFPIGAVEGMARWNGSYWTGLGVAGSVHTLVSLPDGDIAVGGTFTRVGSVVSPLLARLTTTCPATATVVGSGCNGAAGLLGLASRSAPWIGTTCRSVATGLPLQSVVVEALGTSQVQVPLATVHPQGLPGCVLTTDPVAVRLYLPPSSTLELTIPVSNNVAFVGFTMFQQVITLELNPTFGLAGLAASNSLQLVKGSF